MNHANDNQCNSGTGKSASGKHPWYTKTGWIIVLLILFFPVGLYLMWKYCKWGKKTKAIITAVILIFALLGSGDSKDPDSSGSRNMAVASESHEAENPSTAPVAAGTSYVANTNTGKFHYPSCRYVDDIKPKNRWDYTGTREDLISMGYVPCKVCTP